MIQIIGILFIVGYGDVNLAQTIAFSFVNLTILHSFRLFNWCFKQQSSYGACQYEVSIFADRCINFGGGACASKLEVYPLLVPILLELSGV